MAETLYRKHRPQTFADMVGQRHVRTTLEHALTNSRVAHAYLFTGPRGVGKTTAARLLARAVNCTGRGKKPEPCNHCDYCKSILAGQAIDVLEIDAASQTGVDNVRENIIQSARVAPVILPMKVFIIDEVHMLSIPAFNALLKIVEEPPAHAMFILATTEVHRVPETIISRTQRFDFQRIPLEDMIARLDHISAAEKHRLEKGVAERIARYAAGSMRDAESLLGQLFSFNDHEITNETLDMVLPRSDHGVALTILEAMIPGRANEAITAFHTAVRDGADVMTLLQDILTSTRHALLLAIDSGAVAEVGREEDAPSLERLLAMARSTTPTRLVTIIDTLIIAVRQMRDTAIDELPLEIAIVTACLDDRQPPPTTPLAGTMRPRSPSGTSPKSSVSPEPPSAPTTKQKKTEVTESSDDNIRNAWTALQQDSSLAPGLALSVKQATLENITGQTLRIHVPYQLHADRLKNVKNNAALRERLAPVIGDVTIEVMVDATRAVSEIPPREESTPIASAFTPAKLVPQAVPVASGNDLWDNLVSSMGTDSTNS